jgi:hypothetical protein
MLQPSAQRLLCPTILFIIGFTSKESRSGKKQLSDGVLIALKELDNIYQIKSRFFMSYALTIFKALRFKILSKNWS